MLSRANLSPFQTARTWTDSFDILLDAYQQIGNHIPLLQQHEALFDYSPRMKEVLAFIYEDILDFHQRAIRFFSGRGKDVQYRRDRCPNFKFSQFGANSFVRRGKTLIHVSRAFWSDYNITRI